MVGFKLTAGWIAKYAPELNGQMKEATLKDLLNGSKPFVKPGWRKVAAPSSVHGLADGASLVGLSAGRDTGGRRVAGLKEVVEGAAGQ